MEKYNAAKQQPVIISRSQYPGANYPSKQGAATGSIQVVQLHSRQGQVTNVLVQPKTRNFTQVPSLKSSPLQRRQLQEEDCFDEEYALHTEDLYNGDKSKVNGQQKQVSQWQHAKSSHPLSTKQFANAFTTRRQGGAQSFKFGGAGPASSGSMIETNIQLQPQTGQDMHFQNHALPTMHARGQSMFEVQKHVAPYGRFGLVNHQQLQKKALDDGALGLEEHIPSNRKGNNKLCVKEVEEEDDDYFQDDQEHLMTEQDVEGHDDQKMHVQDFQQDSAHQAKPNHLSGGNYSSQEGNIPMSSHTSSSSDSTPQVLSPLLPKTFLNQKESQQDLHQKDQEGNKMTFGGLQVLKKNMIPSQLLSQSSISTPQTFTKKASISSFSNVGIVRQSSATFKNKDCNETVEDEHDVDVAVTQNISGVATLQNLQVFQDARCIEIKPTFGKTNNETHSFLQQAAQINALKQSSTQYGNYGQKIANDVKPSSCRSASEQKFGRLQKLESKSMMDFKGCKESQPQAIFMTVDNNNKSSNKQDVLAQATIFQHQSVEKRQVYKASNQIINHTRSNVKPIVKTTQRGISSSVRPELLENQTELMNDDLETELLKEEYLKLKKTLNKLKTESNTNPSKNTDQRRKTAQHFSSIAAPLEIRSQHNIIETVSTPHTRKAVPKISDCAVTEGNTAIYNDKKRLVMRPNSTNYTEKQQPRSIVTGGSIDLRFSHEKIEDQRDIDRLSHSPPSERIIHYQPSQNIQTHKKRDTSNHSKMIFIENQSKTTKINHKRKNLRSNERGTSKLGSSQSSLENFVKISKHQENTNKHHVLVSNIKSSSRRYQQSNLQDSAADNEDDTSSHYSLDGSACPKSMIIASSSESRYTLEGDDEHEGRKKVSIKHKQQGRKDRKHLKININMNSVSGAPQNNNQYSDSSVLHQSNEELLQRQILQQQQFLFAAIAAQQQQQYQMQQPQHHQLLLQQQLAFQHHQQQHIPYQADFHVGMSGAHFSSYAAVAANKQLIPKDQSMSSFLNGPTNSFSNAVLNTQRLPTTQSVEHVSSPNRLTTQLRETTSPNQLSYLIESGFAFKPKPKITTDGYNDEHSKKQVQSRNQQKMQQNMSSPVNQFSAPQSNNQRVYLPTTVDRYSRQEEDLMEEDSYLQKQHRADEHRTVDSLRDIKGPNISTGNRRNIGVEDLKNQEHRKTGHFGGVPTLYVQQQESALSINELVTNKKADKLIHSQNTTNQESTPKNARQSQNNDLSNSKEQDKKGPQALWIGFEDVNQVKDPFQNKPMLKSKIDVQEQYKQKHQQQKDLQTNRSKSAKGSNTPNQGGLVNKLADGINRVTQKQHIDKMDKQNTEQKPIPNQKQNSPVKVSSAVIIIQNDQQNQSRKTDPPKRPGTSKASLQKLTLEAQTRLMNNNHESVKESIKAVSIDLAQLSSPVHDDLDPKHNLNFVIEIFDKRPKLTATPQSSTPNTLASMFKAKKRDVVDKLEQRKQQQTHQDIQDCSIQVEDASKKEKSKFELFQLRKQMMKSSIKRKDDNFTTMIENNSCPIKKLDNSEVESNKHNHLMDRLADGKKVSVDKKEMKRLTNKNYMNLPEIKKKREEELKRAEIQARKAATAEYLKQLDDSRKKRAAATQKKKGVSDSISFK